MDGDLNISEEELQTIADDTREKNIAYGREYHRQQRLEATPGFKASQAKANAKQRPKTKEKQDQARAEKRFYCDVRDVNRSDNGRLKETL